MTPTLDLFRSQLHDFLLFFVSHFHSHAIRLFPGSARVETYILNRYYRYTNPPRLKCRFFEFFNSFQIADGSDGTSSAVPRGRNAPSGSSHREARVKEERRLRHDTRHASNSRGSREGEIRKRARPFLPTSRPAGPVSFIFFYPTSGCFPPLSRDACLSYLGSLITYRNLIRR